MHNLHGLLFAYESSFELKELVERRTNASIPFGGRYRAIDFPLSSMVNAGVSDIGVVMQQGYQSLLDHLGNGRDWNLSRRVGGLKLLPPLGYAEMQTTAYRSRMEALKAVYSYFDHIRQDYVMLARGDVVANLPVEEIFRAHIDSGADMTVVCTARPELPLQGSSFLQPGPDGYLTGVIQDPVQEPEGYQNMEVYILSKDLLVDIVRQGNALGMMEQGDFITVAAGGRRVKVVIFDGFVAGITSVERYFSKSMALLDAETRRGLFLPERAIMTKERSDVSTYYDSSAVSKNCLIADGCYIEGKIENCILFRGVKVGKGAVLRSCILMQDTVVGEGANLSHVITDKNVTISPYVTLSSHETYPITIGKNAKI